jgi:hypothetical protein
VSRGVTNTEGRLYSGQLVRMDHFGIVGKYIYYAGGVLRLIGGMPRARIRARGGVLRQCLLHTFW